MPNKVTVLVYCEAKDRPWENRTSAPRPFVAFAASNPKLKASGSTEEDAVQNLKELILSHLPNRSSDPFFSGSGRVSANVREIDLSDVLVADIMEG